MFGTLSDRLGKQLLILAGIALQGVGLLVMANASKFFLALLAGFLLGLGTSMAYPTLIAQVANKATPLQRASALGLYWFFRDGGMWSGQAWRDCPLWLCHP